MFKKIIIAGLTAIFVSGAPMIATAITNGFVEIDNFTSLFAPRASRVISDYGFDEKLAYENPNLNFHTAEPLSDGENISPISEKNPLPYPDFKNLTAQSAKIVPTTYGKSSGNSYINLDIAGQVRNKTTVPNTALLEESRKYPEWKIDFNSNEPQVLIMHTHTTECFEEFEREYYDNSFGYRTTDPRYNMVAVGEEIKKELEKLGICTIHDDTINDYPKYNGAYDRSAEVVKEYLRKYPGIKVVLDIHRDAITNSDGSLAQPVAEINGKKAAQIMIISGCDNGTYNMPNYMKNFRFSSLLQSQLEYENPGLTRPILFDYRHYNQELTTGSILIEVGSHGNTLEQVKYSGQLIGKSLAHSLMKIKS
ncbi:MAG: stage II sporulation protein P [Ruminococcus sp.]|jgi:stage II sporulation protein P|nr:stage II sporulation protein P [Ruminococcus sp.]